MLATFVLHFAHPIHSYNDKPSPSEVERGLTSKMVGQPIIYQLLVYNIYIDINVPRDVGKKWWTGRHSQLLSSDIIFRNGHITKRALHVDTEEN